MSSETWAHLSNALVYSTIVVLFLAVVAFALDLALGSGRRRAAHAQQRRVALQRQAAGGAVANGGLQGYGNVRVEHQAADFLFR